MPALALQNSDALQLILEPDFRAITITLEQDLFCLADDQKLLTTENTSLTSPVCSSSHGKQDLGWHINKILPNLHTPCCLTRTANTDRRLNRITFDGRLNSSSRPSDQQARSNRLRPRAQKSNFAPKGNKGRQPYARSTKVSGKFLQ
ncbi:hypothetical protein SAMN05421783_108121 [Thiocapsa roseopersicina]|uniref:Uncharacterized protein n=1 Tax=Thiocapsa roseopersicina TaxID=1058 RepID=A0A1H2WAV0_THIRO|nr:hypothetical protein SAMN05421783_108121 [Thiocapsa roseopersicina]